jgi:hypothetical protein
LLQHYDLTAQLVREKLRRAADAFPGE